MMEYLKWKEKNFVSAVIYVHNAEAYIEESAAQAQETEKPSAFRS